MNDGMQQHRATVTLRAGSLPHHITVFINQREKFIIHKHEKFHKSKQKEQSRQKEKNKHYPLKSAE